MTCDFGDPPSQREHSNMPLALASEGQGAQDKGHGI